MNLSLNFFLGVGLKIVVFHDYDAWQGLFYQFPILFCLFRIGRPARIFFSEGIGYRNRIGFRLKSSDDAGALAT